MLHRVLNRQLKKLGLEAEAPPDSGQAWRRLLERVSSAYRDADQDRYLLERSLAISSQEMQELYDRLLQTSESRIAAERDKLRAVISSLGAGLCTLDVEGRVLSINPECERLLGYSEAEVLGTSFFERMGGDGSPASAAGIPALETLIASGQPYHDEDGEFVRRDGTPLPVSYTLNPIMEDGALRGAVLVFFDTTRRKRAETALRESEQRFRDLFESSPDAVFVEDFEGNVLDANPAADRLHRVEPGGLIGRNMETLVPPAQREHARQSFDRMIAGDLDRLEASSWTEDGAEVPVEISVSRITQHQQPALLLQVRDVSARKQAEEALRESEARYKQLVEHASDIIYWTDMEGRFTYGNPVALRTVGYAEEEVAGKSYLELIRPDFRDDAFRFYTRQFQEQIPNTYYEFPVIAKDGTEVWIGQNVQLVWEDERIVGFQAVARDITGRRRVEEELRAAKEELERRVAARTAQLSTANQQLRVELSERKQAERQIRKQATLLDHAQDAICVLDLDERITYWNKSAERLYGWTCDEAVGRAAGPFLFDTDQESFARARTQVAARGEWTGELHQVTKAGNSLTVESRWTLVQSPDDEAGSILIVNTDITERKALEMQFLRAQRMESLGTLAGGIAHDLNNILGPILMSTQMLQMRLADARSRKLLRTMERSTQRGADLVRQVLSFARGVKGERAAVQLRPLITELARILKDTLPRSIDIRLDVAEDLWTVEGDVTQLHQVLMNLCVNARDAMPDGGCLDISAENVELEPHYARLHVDAAAGRYVFLRVTDTGTGMTPAVQDKIFEPFFTTKEKGTGLGLSTALGIITGHGGFIHVYSEEGRGTCFKIYLPAGEQSLAHPVTDPTAERQTGNGELVLVVDDERPFREITQQLLEEHGYRAVTARDGAEALDLYVQYRDEVRALITDIMMPTMDGRALIQEIRELRPDLKVIAVSGLSTNESLIEIAGVSVHAFLSKPYETTRLLATLSKVLNEKDVTGVPTSL